MSTLQQELESAVSDSFGDLLRLVASKQPKARATGSGVRSLFTEFNLTLLVPKPEQKRRAQQAKRMAAVAKAVAPVVPPARVFAVADASDLPMFAIDYQI